MIYKEKDRVIMELNPKADAYMGLKRPNRDPPVIKPRSRSLDDLPGHIRVPVLKRPEPRLKPRLDATAAGLQELKVLREKHEKLFEDAKISMVRTVVNSVENQEDTKGSSRTIRQHSASSLGRITEEETDEPIPSEVASSSNIERFSLHSNIENCSAFDNSNQAEPALHQIRSRRPLSVSDSSFLENELNEHGNLGRRNSWSHKSSNQDVVNTTIAGSARSLRQYDKRLSESAFLRNRHLPKTEATVNQNIVNSSGDTKEYFSASKQKLHGRSKSLSFTVSNNSRNPIQSSPLNHNTTDVEPKARRASLQCEHVITKHTPFIPMSKFLSDLKLSYSSPGPVHAVLMQYGGQSKDSSASTSAKTEPKSARVRRALFRLEKTEAIDELTVTDKSNYCSNKPNVRNDNINEVPNVKNKTIKSKSDAQNNESSVKVYPNIPSCPDDNKQPVKNTCDLNDYEINNNNHKCDKNIERDKKTSTVSKSDMNFNTMNTEDNDNVFIADPNKLNNCENEYITNDSKTWKKTFSLASDEGYVPSLSDHSRVRSRLSIRSESSWMSSEFDDTTSTVDSGVILPVSHARERALRTSFASSSISIVDDTRSSMSDSGLDLVAPSLTEKESKLKVRTNSTMLSNNCDKRQKDEKNSQIPKIPAIACDHTVNKSAEDETSVLKPFLETAL